MKLSSFDYTKNNVAKLFSIYVFGQLRVQTCSMAANMFLLKKISSFYALFSVSPLGFEQFLTPQNCHYCSFRKLTIYILKIFSLLEWPEVSENVAVNIRNSNLERLAVFISVFGKM